MSEAKERSIIPFSLEATDTPVRHHSPVLPHDEMPVVACAFCGSEDTEPQSIYGCHMMLAAYFCNSCRTSFDWVREEWETAGT